MKILCLPTNQQYEYVSTGKFKAPTPDWKHETFFLDEYELFVITEGVLYLNYNNENFEVKPGEYLLIPPCNSWRRGYRTSYCAFYWMHFNADLSNNIPQVLQDDTDTSRSDFFTIPQTGTIPKFEKVIVLMKQLQDMVKSNYPTITINAMTTTIITELYGQLTLLSPLNNISASSKQIYNDIFDYINTHINENLKVSDISDAFGYNEKYLSHKFSEVTGMPLKQYLIKSKIDKANFMLSDTNKSISEIASELAFSDSHNFARCYKKATGLTPSEYRNAYNKRLLYHV